MVTYNYIIHRFFEATFQKIRLRKKNIVSPDLAESIFFFWLSW